MMTEKVTVIVGWLFIVAGIAWIVWRSLSFVSPHE